LPLALDQVAEDALQGFVLKRCLPPDVAELLHESPQEAGRRLYRPIVFSDLFPVNGRHTFLLGGLFLTGRLAEHVAKKLFIEGIEFETVEVPVEALGEEMVFVSLSPIYLRDSLGRHLYPPRHRRAFERRLEEHLRRKALAVFGKELEKVRVRVLFGRTVWRRYKDLRLPAALAGLRIEGDPLARTTALLLGAGGRTAQGFSMVVPALPDPQGFLHD